MFIGQWFGLDVKTSRWTRDVTTSGKALDRLQSLNRAIRLFHPGATANLRDDWKVAIPQSGNSPFSPSKHSVNSSSTGELQSLNRAIRLFHPGATANLRDDWKVAIPQSGNSPFSLSLSAVSLSLDERLQSLNRAIRLFHFH